MRVLVTGSAGRIGARMCQTLCEKGYWVRGMDLNATPLAHELFTPLVHRIDDAPAAARACEDVDVVVHLAAIMSWLPSARDKLYHANVDATRCILEAAVAAKVKRFVFASSGEVYPENNPCYLPIDEQHPLRPNSIYGLTKLLGEELVRFHARTSSLETVILRFAHTQNASELLDPSSFFSGPRFFLRTKIEQQLAFGNHANVRLLRAADLGSEALVLSRNENGRAFKMHITDSRDMVAGIVLAIDELAAAGQVFNLGATDPVDFAYLVPAMARLTQLPVVEIKFPGPGVYYHTSNASICKTLGYQPEWTIEKMLSEAARVWSKRQ